MKRQIASSCLLATRAGLALTASATLMMIVTIGVAAGCESTAATEANVVSEFSTNDPATSWTIVKVWYRSTLFVGPIAPGETSEETLRVATGSEPAYAILRMEKKPAPIEDGGAEAGAGAGAGAGAMLVVAARTRGSIEFSVGEKKPITLSPATMLIGCGGINGLPQPDYELIKTRIFPGDPLPAFGQTGCGDQAAAAASSSSSPPSADASAGRGP